MDLSRVEFKAEGLDSLKRFLLAEQTPIAKAELARRLNVNRSTVGHWVETLEAMGVPILYDENKRITIDRQQYFTHLSLSRHEGITVMLALRLLQQFQDKPNLRSVETLYKLGLALKQGIAPQVGLHVLAMADYQRVTQSSQSSDYQRFLDQLGDAWIDSRKVNIRYQPLKARRPFDDVFHPYWLEPSALGHSTYVIGYSELTQAIRIRKVERIKRLPVLLDETFTIPESFSPQRLLSGAWGIWFDVEDQPTTIKLRFSGLAAKRVPESRWHQSERSGHEADGHLVWTADIDEVQEILPWIRSWGADCEVLEPQSLRDMVKQDLLRLAHRYEITFSPLPSDEDDGYDNAVLSKLLRR